MAYRSKQKIRSIKDSEDKGDIGPNEIGALVREAETNYLTGQTTISKHVQISMYDTVNKIDAYLNSKFIEGSDKNPFFNIVTAAVNIWYRATDIDRKQIKIKAAKAQDTITSFLATVHLQDWMRRDNFGTFLNDWGRALARYGSAVVKFVEKNGMLHANVVSWQRLITDAIDFDNNIKVEVLELTEAQLYQREGYDPNMIEKLCDARKARENLDHHNIDVKPDYIKLYEVHGLLPLSYLTGKKKDQDEYVQQMHVISFVASKEEGQFDDYTLVSGREEKDPYMITHLIKEEGQTLSIGAVQHLFEAQWMMNHTVKSIKDQLDLSSKLIFQTADPRYVGKNALTAVSNGQILIHDVNQPLTQLQNNSHDISALQSFGEQWKALSNEITGVSESMLGNTSPSGTAWRQVEAILQESHSLFELMTQNKGLAIEEMLRIYVIPFIKKQLNTSKEISATLEGYDITKIDSAYIKRTAIKATNQIIKDKILSGQDITPDEQQILMQAHMTGAKTSLNELGNQRYFVPSDIDDTTWKEIFKDIEWDVEVDVTGESVDANAMTTLNTMLTVLAKNPGILQDPNIKMIFTKILNLTGAVSPLELSTVPDNAPQVEANPQQTQGQPVQSPIQPPPTQPTQAVP